MAPWQLVVLVGAFAVVAALAMPKRTKAGDSAANMSSMQHALEQFMENMEADNRELVETLAKSQQQHKLDNASRDDRIAALERRCQELEDKLTRSELRQEEQVQALRLQTLQPSAPVPQPPSAELPSLESPAADEQERESEPIRARYAELFDLHRQGKSIDAIAKKLSMNKGEVMLILQLAKQEEERRV